MKKFIVLGLIAMLFVQCSNMINSKPFSEMTVKEKSIYIMTMYNKQYDEYLALYRKDNFSEEEKKILKAKYQFLKELNPLINLYVGYAATGEIPPAEIETKLIQIINKAVAN